MTLFAKATNWKAYWGQAIEKYIGTRVLEVGAGIGATAQRLCTAKQQQWVALEPDPKLAEQINLQIMGGKLPSKCEVRVGTLADIEAQEKFNTILYIDVLEHINDDRSEVHRAAAHLERGGYLVVLSPAHQMLFTAFDSAIGHFRRYNKRSLLSLVPAGLTLEKVFYLDSVGLAASLGNRFVLKSAAPSEGQIQLWDKCMVPISRIVDPLIGNSIGKTVIGVWRRDSCEET
ncbi:class I SAM-dependent methyltransferase [Tardiphaga sp. 862_B3_N4_1]|uniref:class I SAM-dependent methyltransferase n=1 Tax=Tardiphaga sp. 862_B3_N4_1 TaxID=3240764 RepID=UPI003F28C63F